LRETAREWLDDGVYVLQVKPFGALHANTETVDRSS